MARGIDTAAHQGGGPSPCRVVAWLTSSLRRTRSSSP
jgi:hypothetical protein